MQMNPVGWFEIYVDDMPRAKAFYEALLDTSLEPLEDVAAGGNSTMVYFSCQDCAVEESRAEAAGGKVMHSKFAIGPHGFIAIVADSEGNMIGLHSMS